jgi:hypothetical protein
LFMLELNVEKCWMLVIIEVHYETTPHYHEDWIDELNYYLVFL